MTRHTKSKKLEHPGVAAKFTKNDLILDLGIPATVVLMMALRCLAIDVSFCSCFILFIMDELSAETNCPSGSNKVL